MSGISTGKTILKYYFRLHCSFSAHYLLQSATLLTETTFVVSAYFSNTEFSVSERFGEAVQHLTGDSDTDVRAFFNPVEVSSNSEFYDSDGEPIADVSSLPV